MNEDSYYTDYKQITSQLSKVTADLNKILNEFNCIPSEMKCSQSPPSPQPLPSSTSQVPQNENANCRCYNSDQYGHADWYVSPLHKPYHICPDDYIINQNYKPGYLGALFDLKNTKDIRDHPISEIHGLLPLKHLHTAKGEDLNCRICKHRLLDQDICNLYSRNKEEPIFNIYIQLAKLQLDKLHLTEELLLEKKRQQELERTRPPQRYWYMLRSKEFSKEHMKNRNMLKYNEYSNDILRYRKQLLKASRDAKKHFLRPFH